MGKFETKDISQRALKNYSQAEQREIIKVFGRLRDKIDELEHYGTKFENIYNNDSIKYDVFKSNFYTFKSRGKDNSQIRILYRFVRKCEKEYDLEMHRVYIKRRNSKEYMDEFAIYVRNYIKNQR